MEEESGALAVSYQCKSTKNVILLSTMHKTGRVGENEEKKSEIVEFYNKNKIGVDTVDQMLRLYSTKAANQHWPVVVFYDILDKAALNSHILFKEATGSSISRREFILQLSKGLCEEHSNNRQSPKEQKENYNVRYNSLRKQDNQLL
jgi:hypothetical protein